MVHMVHVGISEIKTNMGELKHVIHFLLGPALWLEKL